MRKLLFLGIFLFLYGGALSFAQKGTAGNLTWSITEHILTLSGTGEIPDYAENEAPWHAYLNSIQSLVIEEGITTVGSFSFHGFTRLAQVNLPQTLIAIGERAFSGIDSLRSLTLPDNLSTLADGAFMDCTHLEYIRFPDNLTRIGKCALHYTPWYVNQPDGLIYIGKVLYEYKGTMPPRTVITVKEGTLSISPFAFWNRTQLCGIHLPESLTSIEKTTFSVCLGLENLVLPPRITSIGQGAFASCQNLKSISFPDSLHTIGENAFEDCLYLTDLKLPSGLKTIGAGAFSFCYNLRSLFIPEGVESIGNQAFTYCNLGVVSLPSSLRMLGEGVFSNNSDLSVIYHCAEVPPTAGSACFSETDVTSCTLYVPHGSLAAYQCAEVWKDFIHIVEDGLTGNPSLSETSYSVEAVSCGIHIRSEKTIAVQIHSLSGQLIYSGTVNDSLFISLKKGIYLLKINQNTQKVVVF